MRQACEDSFASLGNRSRFSRVKCHRPLGGFHMLQISAALAAMVAAGVVCWFLDTVSTDDSD